MIKHVDCSLITGWFSYIFVNENFFFVAFRLSFITVIRNQVKWDIPLDI